MRLHRFLGLLLAVCAVRATNARHRDYDRFDYYALHLDVTQSPEDVADYFGFELQGQIGPLDDHFLFSRPKHEADLVREAMEDHTQLKKRGPIGYTNDILDSVLLHQKQKLRPPMEKRGVIHPHNLRRQYADSADDLDTTESAVDKGITIAKQLGIEDPIFHEQWHLYNPVELGHDLNVTGVWQEGITGKGATVCIVDDGLDMDSLDLKDNYFAAGSFDFNDVGPEPKPRLSDDRHGTRCAGEVSAVKNNVCGVGVAWNSRISGIRILSKPISDIDEAEAMTYGFQENQIYSCSWGPPDNGMEMGEPGILIKRAMVKAVQEGRSGLGTIYVFAAGNGAPSDDNCNFDGYTNSIYSITVGAIDRANLHPYYSEKCSAQLIVTYSSGSGDAIHTTDVGAEACYDNHGGTSAAGPLAAGVFALALEIRPDLTWRDMQWLTVMTAAPLENPSDWQETPMGKKFSHQYGYGKLDAGAFVEAAKDFKSVKPQAWFFSPWQHVQQPVPQGQRGLASTYVVTSEAMKKANLERIEHVTVLMNVKHTRRGDLSVELRSPSGIVSHLSTTRQRDEASAGYVDWTFMSVAHWGEDGVGPWRIIVKDTNENEHTGEFIDWRLNFFGECDDPASQKMLPIPTLQDFKDHEIESVTASHVSVDVPTATSLMDIPSDHPHRPVNAKPTDEVAPVDMPYTTDTGASPPDSSPYASPIPPPPDTSPYPSAPNGFYGSDGVSPSGPETTGVSSSTLDNFLPSPFPTFGVSKRSQAWIYAAAALIIIFLISISVYLCVARRRANRRENYEFEMVAGDDDEDHGANGHVGGRRKGKRAGELYDAFAGASDEELFSDDASEDREEIYHDEHASRENFREKGNYSGSSESSGNGVNEKTER